MDIKVRSCRFERKRKSYLQRSDRRCKTCESSRNFWGFAEPGVICPAPRRKIQAAAQHLSSCCLCLHLDQFISNFRADFRFEPDTYQVEQRLGAYAGSNPRFVCDCFGDSQQLRRVKDPLGSNVGLFKHSAPARHIFRDSAWPGYLALGVTKSFENIYCPIIYRNRVGRGAYHGRICFRRN